MGIRNMYKYLFVLMLTFLCNSIFGQGNVPLGINYQAVARDNFGKELANKSIDVRFSIISENPLGTLVYEELHSAVITSKYGVFSLIIGKGVPTGGTVGDLSQVNWSQALHYLKVEVKFENDFIDMGTMQFLSVPYALYARKSLEPGPQGVRGDIGPQGLQGVQGQKGDRGDPASDNQTLSFDGTNLSISIGNGGTPSTVNLSTLNVPHQLTILGDTLSIMGGNKVGLPNQIQNLQLDNNNILKINKNPNATPIDLTRFLDDKQQLSFNSTNNTVTITGGNSIDLTPMKQDLLFAGNTLSITNKLNPNAIDLSRYLQQLIFTPADNKLEIIGGNTVDLTLMKQDLLLAGNTLSITNKLSPTLIDLTKYLQQLIFTPADNKLEIVGGNTVDLTPIKQDLYLNPSTNILTISNKTSPTEIDLTPYKQILSYNSSTNILSLTNGGSVNLSNIIAFRVKKTISKSADALSNVIFVPETVPTTDEYNDGDAFNRGTGDFIAPVTGIYCFNVSYFADGSGGSRKLSIYYESAFYEDLAIEISAGSFIPTRSITMKINSGEIVKLVINTGTSTQTGTGSFSGYRVY